MIGKNKVFLLPDRLAHYREPVFIELAKKLKKNNKDLFLYYDPEDFKVTNIPMPSIERLKLYYKFGYLRNLYFGKTGRGGKVIIFQFGIIISYLINRPKILIAWGEAHRISTFVLLILSKIFNGKVVLWTHGFYGNETFPKKILRILFYKLADKLLIYGKYSFLLTKKFLPNKKIYLIGNSIAIDKTKFRFNDEITYKKHRISIFKKYKINKFQNNQNIVLSFIGRLTYSKRIDLLIKLLSRNDAKNMILWLIGSGDEYENLLKYSKKLNLLNRIKFFGQIYDQREIKSILSVSDIFICPSNLGLSVCNALSAGIPIITNEKMEMQMPESECLRSTEFAEFIDFENEKLLVDKIKIVFKKFNSNFDLKYKIVDHYHTNFDPKEHALRICNAIHDIVI